MFKNPDGTFSLSRCIFGMAWFVSVIIIIRYLFTDLSTGASVAAAIGALLTPAGAVYAMRSHSMGVNSGDPKCKQS